MEQSEEGSGPPSAPPHPRSPPPAPLSPVAKLEQYKSERAQCVHGDDGAIIIASDEVKTKPAVGVAFFSNSPKDAALGGAVRLTELIEGYVASPDFVGIQSNNVLKHQFSSIQAVSARLSEHVVEKLLHNKEVLRIEPDCIIKLDDGEMTQARRLDQRSYGNASRRALASTDGVQIDAPSWGIDRIDSRSGTDGVYTHGSALGSGTRVYVLDTGVLISHNDFDGRAVAGMSSGCGPKGCDGRDCQPSTGAGCWQFEGVITDAACHNHGTHCASTVGGRMYGVAKGATLVAVQVPS